MNPIPIQSRVNGEQGKEHETKTKDEQIGMFFSLKVFVKYWFELKYQRQKKENGQELKGIRAKTTRNESVCRIY